MGAAARLKPYFGDRTFYRQALIVMIPVVIQQLINTLFNVVDNVMVGGIGALAMSAVTAANKPYLRQALIVMIPVVIQQLINTLFNVVDNVMVGGIGALAMSAVTAANKPYLIYNGFFFGMAGAGGLLISQFYGAGERDTCQGLFGLQILAGLVSSLLFGAAMFLFPRPIMQIFIQDPATVELGVSYMRMVCFSYIPGLGRRCSCFRGPSCRSLSRTLPRWSWA